jgi:hypothetical protein
MTRSQRSAILWFLAGVAFLVAGLITNPRRPFLIALGAAYFAIAALSLHRARGPRPPHV